MLLQSLPHNVYDCFQVNRDLIKDPTPKLFGNRWIGNYMYTNLQLPNLVASADYHVHVENWYARTNIPESPALTSWANTVMVTLTLNSNPVMMLPLSDLLQRRQGQPGLVGRFPQSHEVEQCSVVAQRMYESSMYRELGYSWSGLSQGIRDAYITCAALARNAFGAAPAIVVPPRAHVSALVVTNTRSNGAFLETMPAVAPMALVWLHLEGHQESSSAV